VFFLKLHVKVLATVSKTTDGRVSSWKFCQDDGKFFALRTLPTLKVTECKNLEDLRSLYKAYTTNEKYGFTPVEQLLTA